MSWLVKSRAFGVGANLQHLLDDNDPESKVSTTLGGRIDVAKIFDDIKVVGSVTDATLKDTNSAPWAKDLLITAEKRVNDNVTGMLGVDLGSQSVVARVHAVTDLANKDVSASATYFSANNAVRTEATAVVDERATLWGAHTFNEEGHLASSTYVNLKERERFIIAPFTVPIATSAAAITLEHEGYVVEPAIDFNQKAGYLSVAKAHDRYAFKGSYAFKEEVALLEVGYSRLERLENEAPLVRGFLKAPVSVDGGVGPLSIGIILDREWEL
ncbi:hypothetical protein WJX81_000640 [Elliptochloris bilobata]|uniref:Major capsid protein n=1 Tax=Elliptochloris bilobata TaxID=381761 RepID=A0AAW1RR88_9CHLO